MKISLIILTSVIGFAVLAEVGLRLVLGLGNPPLYVADNKIGYLLAPNQNLKRMGNKIQINQYSMRSETIEESKPDSLFRVLLLGDSIVNGGWWTDQQETITTYIQNKLTDIPQSPQGGERVTSDNNPVQVLNASANSWGPRNELAYLKRFGLFESQVLVLVINTDDLFSTKPNSAPVGRDRNYPDQKPLLALIEAYEKFMVKPKPFPNQPEEKGDRVEFNLEAIREINAIAKSQNTQFILAMTPLLREFGETGSRDYEKKARKRLEEFTIQENIIYIDFLPVFDDFPQPEFLYRDHIHLSPQGNHLVSETLAEPLKSFLSQNE